MSVDVYDVVTFRLMSMIQLVKIKMNRKEKHEKIK